MKPSGKWTLTKRKPDIYVDLSAIAKGYGSIRWRCSAGARVSELPGGGWGEVVASGKGPGERPWQISLETPDGGAQDIEATVVLEEALATSGNYRNFKLVDGKRVGHTLDPRNGKPVEHRTASVSVIAPPVDADGWATALLVLGAEAGVQVADREKIAARFLIGEEGGKFSTVTSKGWPGGETQPTSP